MKRSFVTGAFCTMALGGGLFAADLHFQVQPGVYDPLHTDLVQSAWLPGIGCPTNAPTASDGVKKPDATYTDPACPTGDSKDNKNEGLLLVKTGPEVVSGTHTNHVAAGATIMGLPHGLLLTELGYDLRKPVAPMTTTTAVVPAETGGANLNDPRGSHCGQSPRFIVITQDGNVYYVACTSATQATGAAGWIRLQWGGGGTPPQGVNARTGTSEAITSPVTTIEIELNDGQDTPPDNFGAAILDNININGTRVGQGGGGTNQ
jgi:hypothetical protein